MARTIQDPGKIRRRTAIGFIALMGLLAPALPSAASTADHSVIVLKGATSAEGIAAGEGTTFYAGDRLKGDIYRGDIRTGKARLFIDAPGNRQAVGMKADTHNDLLFVAGGSTGKAFIYDTESGESRRPIQLTTRQDAFINDVALTDDGAWFTNSTAGELYFVPVGGHGKLGNVQTKTLTGPAAELTGAFNLNGIASADDDDVLIVAHSGKGKLFTVHPETGASAEISGVSVANVDGILVRDHKLWAVQNQLNQISYIRLSRDLSSGKVKDVITSENFRVPTTIARFGNTLAAVNAKFGDTQATQFEVVLVPARG